jgi:zinc transport system permease protein
MLDDFFTRAMIAGIGLAMVTGPLGCFVVWRKLAYFGDTLAHAALLGVALSLLSSVNVTLAVFVVAMSVAFSLLALQKRSALSSDALLGMLSHGSLAIGLLAVTRFDLAVVYLGGAVVLSAMVWAWKPLFAVTVNRDLAAAEGIDVAVYDVLLMVLLAAVVAVSIRIVGVMLITSLLIIPAGAARRLSSGPVMMALLSAIIGAVAVLGGLYASLEFNTPSGPSIVAVALLLFVIGLVIPSHRLEGQQA